MEVFSMARRLDAGDRARVEVLSEEGLGDVELVFGDGATHHERYGH